ncbi:hypothetical protein AC628_33960 [Bradyrhizobium sp. NAS96.2]|nr:hypothetical protein AC628_33960 [Bradyrhizobium sp. NAS96.2]
MVTLSKSQIFGGDLTRTAALWFIADASALWEAVMAGFLNSTNVHEDVRSPIIGFDKAISLGRIEPLHGTHRHCSISS